MCFSLTKSTDESDAAIAVSDKWLGGFICLREQPSEQFPCCEGGGGLSCLLWLLTVSPAVDTVPGTDEALGKSVLKINALSEGPLRVQGPGKRINLY